MVLKDQIAEVSGQTVNQATWDFSIVTSANVGLLLILMVRICHISH